MRKKKKPCLFLEDRNKKRSTEGWEKKAPGTPREFPPAPPHWDVPTCPMSVTHVPWLHQLSCAHSPQTRCAAVWLTGAVGPLVLFPNMCCGSLAPASQSRLWMLSSNTTLLPAYGELGWEGNRGPEKFFGTSFGDKPKRPLKLKAMSFFCWAENRVRVWFYLRSKMPAFVGTLW